MAPVEPHARRPTSSSTTLLLDPDLMARAAETLGTQRATDTVRASLEQTVRQAHVRSLLAWELPESADETLAEQRAPRRFES